MNTPLPIEKNAFLFLLLFYLIAPVSAQDSLPRILQESDDRNRWTIVFQDEFNGSGHPNPDRWQYETGYLRNNEAQYYTKKRLSNCRVRNGRLIIEAKNDHYQNHEITSASIHTFEAFRFQYGYVEVRAKVPPGNGTWPAIWMLGENHRTKNVNWPFCGEIDIMEYVGHKPGVIHGTIHTGAFNHMDGTHKGSSIKPELAPSSAFHKYAVHWTKNRIDIIVNDTTYFTFRKKKGYTTAEWPFDQPFYLKLNLAIGGSWGGKEGIDDDIFPATYTVDYVRVYQKE